jgi:hypothetical protein
MVKRTGGFGITKNDPLGATEQLGAITRFFQD